MSDNAPLAIMLLAAEATVASTILPFSAWLLVHAYRRSASQRRLVWVTLFAVLLALPLLAVASPSLTVITLTAGPVAAPAAMAVENPAPRFPIVGMALPAGLLTWGCGASWILVRGLGSLFDLRRLRRLSKPASPGCLPLPLPRGCVVRTLPKCPGPMTWGAARPVILLPEAALVWPRARLEMVLRHELAHVLRRDSLVQAMTLVTCALYWPNPLVWRAARALRNAAEAAADDAVIASGVRQSDYAALLLDLAWEWRGGRATPAGIAMAAPGALSQRVESILSPDPLRIGATPMDALKLALLGGVAAATLTLARPSIAEIAPLSAAVVTVPLAETVVPVVKPETMRAKVPQAQVRGMAEHIAGRPLTAEDRADLDRALASIGPTVRQALADAHIDNVVKRAAVGASAEARREVAKQLAELGPTIRKAITDAHISERVAESLAQVEPQIDAAAAKAREQAKQAE